MSTQQREVAHAHAGGARDVAMAGRPAVGTAEIAGTDIEEGPPKDAPVRLRWARSELSRAVARLFPGTVAAGAIAAVATVLGGLAPVVGAPVIAIVTGILITMVRPPSARLRPGLAFVGRQVLQGSVIMLGLGLSLGQVVTTGWKSLPVLLGTLAAALAVARLVGAALGLRRDLRTLIGVGTAICGASAIAATDAVIGAEEADVSYAIATIFAFNVVAVLTYPTLGHLMGLSQRAFGLWAGTAINDMSSVVAASNIYGHVATSYGVVVKLTRTLAILPIALVIGLRRGHGARSRGVDGAPGARRGAQLRRIFPMFILGFIAAVVANTIGLVPTGWHHGISDLVGWAITAALAAIGLSSQVGHIRRTGLRPVLLGGILWMTVGLTSLALQAVTGSL